jgi:hypothetical protein
VVFKHLRASAPAMANPASIFDIAFRAAGSGVSFSLHVLFYVSGEGARA